MESNDSPRKLPHLINYQPRPYDTLEIELTTRCNLYCPSCPRTSLRHAWLDRDMTWDSFEKISRSFDWFETIHFKGWGEPVLHPHFPEMVRLAHQSGARLVLSTNGAEMFNPGLLPYFHCLLIRLDYGLARTYERRNPQSRFNRAIMNISQILHQRDQNDSLWPKVVIMFVKNRHSLGELPDYLETGVRLAPDRVVFYNPFFHFREVDDRAELPGEVDPGLIGRIDRILEIRAQAAGLDMINQPERNRRRPGPLCQRDPGKHLFVTWNGQTAPCRNVALPLATGQFTRYDQGREESVPLAFTGSLLRDALGDLMKFRTSRQFTHRSRAARGRLGTARCFACPNQVDTSKESLRPALIGKDGS
jgi:MoaA/NifB/PqqE/SkfB family radical SAM enzyme